MCKFALKQHDMKSDFQYSTDFYGMNSYELSDTCMHLLCLAGEASFVFNEHCYHIIKNDLVVIPMPDRVCNLAAHADLRVEWSLPFQPLLLQAPRPVAQRLPPEPAAEKGVI